MAIKIRIRRGTASDWQSENPVLDSGELGVELDTYKLKVGDGSTEWNSLPYVGAGASQLSELNDVDDSLSPNNDDVLIYNGSQWTSGKVNINVQTLNSDTTLTDDGVYLVDTSSGNVTITLPQSGDSNINDTITIKNIGSSGNTVIIQCQGTDQIEGQSSQTLNDGESYTIVDDKNGNFYII